MANHTAMLDGSGWQRRSRVSVVLSVRIDN